MTSLEKIKLIARDFSEKSDEELETKTTQLSKGGLGILGCVAFIQECKRISLAEARDLALSMEIFKNDKITNDFLGYVKNEYYETD